MVRASASGAGGRGFDPGPSHTKDIINCDFSLWSIVVLVLCTMSW